MTGVTSARVILLRFELINVVESADRSAMEYWGTSGVDPTPRRVVEMLDRDGDPLRAVRVFHQ